MPSLSITVCVSTLAAAIVLHGCQSPPHQQEAHDRRTDDASVAVSASTVDSRVSITSTDESLQIAYAMSASSPVVNEPFSIELWVKPMYGQSLSGAAATVDAGMPEHGHGMNVEPTIVPLGGNRFRADNMVFHMSGRWEIYFDITRDGVTSRAQDEITLE